MLLSLYLFESEFINIVAISFTSLILNELIMVALEITTWSVLGGPLRKRISTLEAESSDARHPWMIISEIATFVIYAISMVVLPQYFGQSISYGQPYRTVSTAN